jgi:mannose-6-phosphate isomerase-like protein (cupin superfamily)
MNKPSFHHRKLPDHSTLLSGRSPLSSTGFPSNLLQIWYNNTQEAWSDPLPHAHKESDECFVVLKGSIIVEVEGERFTIGPREFCCFPQGVFHQVIAVHPPVESLMLRSPSVDDKIYQQGEQKTESQ